MVRRLLLFAVLNLFFFTYAKSQVTIGLDEEPVKGAILQLKSQKVAGSSANSIRGLMLPRISFDVVSSASGTIDEKLRKSLKLPAAETTNAAIHTGLLVYNVETLTVTAGSPFEDSKICPGVYVWIGTAWVRAMISKCQ